MNINNKSVLWIIVSYLRDYQRLSEVYEIVDVGKQIIVECNSGDMYFVYSRINK